MPSSVTTTVEDTTPLLVFSPPGAWEEGNSTTDAFASYYSSSTFTMTTVPNANVSFTFQGTSLTIYGAMRPTHGQFTVDLDGTVFPIDGYSSVNMFQVPLFSQSNMQQGTHQVILTNGNSYVDVDFVTWSSDVSQGTQSVVDTAVDDWHPAFSYYPTSAWTTEIAHIGSFLGGTGHSTSEQNAYVQYSFTGDSVALYGSVGPDHAPYSVQIDGGPMANFSATKNNYLPHSLLYRADNLGAGSHSLVMQNQQISSGQVLEIDYAIVYSSSTRSRKLSAGAIGGITLASIALLLALVGLCVFLRQRKAQRRKRRHEEYDFANTPTVPKGLGNLLGKFGILPEQFRLDLHSNNLNEEDGKASRAHPPDVSRQSVLVNPHPPERASASYLDLTVTRSSLSTQATIYPFPPGLAATTFIPTRPPPPLPVKSGQQLQFPSSQSPSRPFGGIEEARIRLEGRLNPSSQPRGRPRSDTEGTQYEPAPPDYVQATEHYEPLPEKGRI
jgi:hypothetical protein